MRFRAHHLHDDKLFDCYVAERTGETPDPRAAEHLIDCGDCSGRYAELARFMDGLRAGGDAETDAVFTADRLRAQQLAIARRIEHVGRPARVISFPGASAAQGTLSIASRTSRIAPRWIAAAAAAGLFVGAGLGMSLERSGVPQSSARARAANARTVSPSPHLTPVATRGSSQTDLAADEAFLSDLEVAL
ncbi:MAG TPA: hypothetical protein VEU08_18475, partial [Vicinamibacterales bacterium]|nr:hypothetical protein [Vicinamibacterales bacterium]